MCDGIYDVEQLPVPPLDLRLILSARLSHRRRVSYMLSVVGRRRFPQFFVQPQAGRLYPWLTGDQHRSIVSYACTQGL